MMVGIGRNGPAVLAGGSLLLAALWAGVASGETLAPTNGRLTVTLPGLSWVVTLDAPGFELEADETHSDGRGRYLHAVNRQTDVILSVRLERSSTGRSARACREAAWAALRARSPFQMHDVRTSERGRLAVLEYHVPEFRGLAVRQKHLNAFLGKDDVCVDMHLSKVRFSPEDGRLFDELLGSVKLIERLGL